MNRRANLDVTIRVAQQTDQGPHTVSQAIVMPIDWCSYSVVGYRDADHLAILGRSARRGHESKINCVPFATETQVYS